MDNMEMIEKLREKADVTYDEAKSVLESLNWNLLDALIALEKEGKLKKEEKSSYTTKFDKADSFENISYAETENSFIKVMKKIFKWIADVLKKGMDNKLVITDDEEGDSVSLPLTILGIFLIVAFWIVVIIFIVAFFTETSFSIEGPDLGTEKVNSFLANIKFSYRKKSDSEFDINDKK